MTETIFGENVYFEENFDSWAVSYQRMRRSFLPQPVTRGHSGIQSAVCPVEKCFCTLHNIYYESIQIHDMRMKTVKAIY